MAVRKIVIIFIIVIVLAVPYSTVLLDTSEVKGDSGSIKSSRQSTFVYHNYTEMESGLNSLDLKYPNLIDIHTAQDLYSLPDCRDGYKIWVVRITNENIAAPKPELLYVGGHHGDEAISIEVPFYLIKWLLENYNTDNNVKHIVDTREIYVIPVLNPYGWENDIRFDGDNEDVNRDYPFGNESNNEALTTVGARAMHELMKSHLFSLGISWHSGDELIYYAGGTPLHNTPLDESPDDKAYRGIAGRLSEYSGSFDGKYIYGPANQVIYSASGAWSDYAYAASWDAAGMDAAYPTGGSRMLSFGVEISSVRKPPENQLGTEIDIYGPPGDVDGYIPKNIRMAYALAELAEPFISIQNRTGLPSRLEPGENLTVSWKVRGAVFVDQTNIQYGLPANPISNYNNTTVNQSGPGGITGTKFSQTIKMPEEEGIYKFVIRARVDQNYRDQFLPEPSVAPQSVYVNKRTNATWTYTNAGRTATGKLDYFSELFEVEIGAEPLNASVVFVDPYFDNYTVNQKSTLGWKVTGAGKILKQIVHLTRGSKDNFDNSIKISEGITEITSSNGTEYFVEFQLPSKWGEYFYMVEVRLESGLTIFSEILHELIYPALEITDYPRQAFIDDTITFKWNLEGTNDPWNMTLMLYPAGLADVEIDERYYEGSTIASSGQYYMTVDAPGASGSYNFFIRSTYYDDINKTTISFQQQSPIEILIKDIIYVTSPTAVFNAYNRTLMVYGIFATCTNRSHGEITPDNTITHEVLIVNDEIEIIYFTDLIWSREGWYAVITHAGDWEEGRYYAIASFWDGEHLGESVRLSNDSSEFEITKVPVRQDDHNETDDDGHNLALIIFITAAVIILGNTVGILVFYHYSRKTRKDSENIEKEDEVKSNSRNK